MTNTFGLRERKKAQLKLDLLNVLLKALKTKPFEAIKVKELCHQVSISEVTFFKYFDKKEELLQYFMMVWNYKREIRLLKEQRLSGKAGIYQFFDDIGQTNNAPHIMNTLIGYLTKLTEKPKELNLSDCEKWLINKKVQLNDVEDLNFQLETYVKEAIAMNELPSSTHIPNFLILLSTIYYGTPVISHLTIGDLSTFYKNNLNILFSLTDK